MELAHTMLRTGSPEEMIEFYKEAFGFELREEKEMETFTLYFLKIPGQKAEIELTYNHGRDGSYEKGEGFGHVAIRIEDQSLKEAYRDAVESGGEDYRPPEECPGNYGFVKDPEGYEVEIIGR